MRAPEGGSNRPSTPTGASADGRPVNSSVGPSRSSSSDDGRRSNSPRDGRPSIVYFVSTLTTGGAQVGLVRLLSGLDLERYDVTVVTVLSKENDVIAELPDGVGLIDLEPLSLRRKPVALYRAVADADVLVCSMYHATLLGRVLGTIARVPVVVNWLHSERFAGRHRELAWRATAGLSELILADSPAVADALREEYGVPADRVRTIPIAGVDTAEFARTDVSSPSGELHVATVGSLIPPKRHDRVLETAAALRERNDETEFVFNVAGTGPLEAELCERRDALGLENVRFHGFVEDVPGFLNRNDVYFHTSAYEGLCIAALEAMACELPVVASPAGGLAHYVEHGASGYLVDDPDPGAFAASLERLADPERRRAFGRRGREIVDRDYSREALVTAFEDVLAECLDDGPATATPPFVDQE